jgi:hypothetical protein
MTRLADAPAGNAQAGPLGLLVVILLAIATFVLIRSMSRHLRRVPASFDPDPPAPPAEPGTAMTAEPGTAVAGAESASDGRAGTDGEPAEPEPAGE